MQKKASSAVEYSCTYATRASQRNEKPFFVMSAYHDNLKYSGQCAQPRQLVFTCIYCTEQAVIQQGSFVSYHSGI
jgi:hypothetical protein